MQWNDDVVARLPEGAVRLATASSGEVQAARHAPSVWGIQWHPEVDDAMVAAWADGSDLPESERTRVLDDLLRSRQELDRSWKPLAERFVALVQARSL
jgi:GMP synthase (glutamine-hydrolysing)